MVRQFLLLSLIFSLMCACQNQSGQEIKTISQEFFSTGPQLVKIPIINDVDADSLLKMGMDIIVIEKNYVIAKLGSQEARQVETMALKMQTFKEEELVQRLIRIVMNENYNLQDISSIGIDIWEVKGDTVLAQAYDKYIRQIQEMGISVEIVERNVRDTVKKRE